MKRKGRGLGAEAPIFLMAGKEGLRAFGTRCISSVTREGDAKIVPPEDIRVGNSYSIQCSNNE